jgi:SAM-dependent methyltransferase
MQTVSRCSGAREGLHIPTRQAEVFNSMAPFGGDKKKGNGRAEQTSMTRRDRVIHDLLRQLPQESLVINVGCGVLQELEHACPGRYLATDLRVLPGYVDFAADASCLPLTDNSVDAVVALELLEHVPSPHSVIEEFGRVLKPGGQVIISVPSTVPRHDEHDYWRFTAQGLGQLCSEVFENGDVRVFGGTFEALGYLAEYYTALVFHRAHLPSSRLQRTFPVVGYWLDRHNNWSTSTTALHTLAFDLLFTGTLPRRK